MKLHDSVGPNPHVVRMFAAEKGIDLPRITVDLRGGENRTPDYVAKNPAGQTPCLELPDGTFLSEITVICEYLEELHPAPPLIGTTALERAETRMWTRRIDLGIVEPLSNGFRAAEGRRMFASRMMLHEAEGAATLKAMAADRLRWLDGQMGDRTWVCGDRFTLADILLFAFTSFGASVGQPLPAGTPWLHAWTARVAARLSAAA